MCEFLPGPRETSTGVTVYSLGYCIPRKMCMALTGKQQEQPLACEGRLKEVWLLGPEKKTRGKTSPKYTECSLKEKGKKLLSLSMAYKRENNGLKLYQRTPRFDTGKTF